MSKIINDKSLEKIKVFRKNLLKIAMWVFVGGVITGALLIIFGGSDTGEVMTKIMATLFLVAIVLAVASNLVRRIEEDNTTIQVFAIIGLCSVLIAAIFWIFCIWEAYPVYRNSIALDYHPLYIVLLIATYLAMFGFLASNIFAIKEYDGNGAIKPLKITAIVSLSYVELYAIYASIISNKIGDDEIATRLTLLSGFAGTIWVISSIIALVISRGAKKRIMKGNVLAERELLEKVHKQLDNLQAAGTANTAEKSDMSESNTLTPNVSDISDEEKMRAEIEKRVRAEMMEKEIREKVEAEMKAKKNAEK